MMLRTYRRIFFAVIVLLGIGVVSFNLWLPTAYHLFYAVGGKSEFSGNAKPDFVSPFTFRWASRLIVRHQRNKCNSSIFKNGERLKGENATITTLINLYDLRDADKEYITSTIASLSVECNIDVPASGFSYSPMNVAIHMANPELVSYLLKMKARTDLPLSTPGEIEDGYDSLMFAIYLQEKAKNSALKKKLNEVINVLLEQSTPGSPAN